MKHLINNKLENIYVQSFYLKDKLVEEYDVIYLKIDSWYEVFVSEGAVYLSDVEKPELVALEDISEDFKYPIIDYSDSELAKKYLDKNIENITKLKRKSSREESGIVIHFEDDLKLTIYENSSSESIEITMDGTFPDDLVELI